MHPRVFFSSVFEDPLGTDLPIREALRNITAVHVSEDRMQNRPIWMAEDFVELRKGSGLGWLRKAQIDIEGIRNADCYIAVLSSRLGNPIHIPDVGKVPTSFFELELLEAALIGKPCFIFQLEGYSPDPSLKRILDFLTPAFPGILAGKFSESQILSRIERIVDLYARKSRNPILRPPRGRLVTDTLYSQRHKPYRVTEEAPPIRFADGFLNARLGEPIGLHRVDQLLNRAKAEQKHQDRLTWFWFAIRALMGSPYNAESASLWDEALGGWSSSGSWFGLHGHAAIAVLAALGSLADMKIRAGETAQSIPHSALASSYYSIAGRAHRQKRNLYALALAHIEAAIAISGDGESNMTRASILLRQGNRAAAIADYERVVQLRRHRGDASYGEVLGELGWALVMNRHARKGVAMLELGLELLRKEEPSGSSVRCARKLAIGYALVLKPKDAIDTAAAAYHDAVSIGAYDQIGWFEQFANGRKPKRG